MKQGNMFDTKPKASLVIMTSYKYVFLNKRKTLPSTDSFIDVLIESKKNGITSSRNIRRFPFWTCDDERFSPKVIVLRGEAGSGKTTLCNFIFSMFLSDRTDIIDGLEEFKLVFPVKAPTVTTCDIIEFLRTYIGKTLDMCHPEAVPLFLQSSKILWLVDGFEEATDAAKKLVEKLFAAQANNSHLIVLTTQPHQDLSDALSCVSKESIIEVYLRGLNKKGFKDFVGCELGNKRNKFTKELKLIGKDLLKESHNPMKLKLMVKLWKDGRLSKEAGASSFYEAMMEIHTEKVKEKLKRETILNVTNISDELRDWMHDEFERYLI